MRPRTPLAPARAASRVGTLAKGLALVLLALGAGGASAPAADLDRYERPRDPYFPAQWNLENRGQPQADDPNHSGVYDADIDGTEAFASGHTGRDVVVAIIGTGFEWKGSPLEPVLWTNPGELPENGLDDDANGLVDDVHGYDFGSNDADPRARGPHDQTVAEIAVSPHDRRGLAGVAPGSRLMVLKIADDRGQILMGPVPLAISYALRHRARVIFMPWSAKGRSCGDPDLVPLSLFLERASAHALIIAGQPGEWPACLPSVVSVRASRPDDRSHGLPASDVDFAAPGHATNNKVYVSYAIGTAAGASALLFAQDPDRSPADVREILRRTADRVHPEIRPYKGGWNGLYGSGRINVARALGTDFDGDGILDADDPDADGDRIPDREDPCTLDPDPTCGRPGDEATKETTDGS
jgi:hypothetical protein